MSDYLFTYGTLRKGFPNPFADILEQEAQHLGPAKIPGLLFEIKQYPGAIYLPKCLYHISGDLFRLNDPEHTLSSLDSYEQVGTYLPQPNEYIRTTIPLNWQAQTLQVWIYLYHWSLADKQWIPDGDYMNFITDHGLF